MPSTDTDALFECRRCGQCCQGYGGTYLTEGDIEAIAGHTGIGRQMLLDRYCARSGRRWVLTQRNDRYCVFWDGLCRIHPVKPAMCRKWPYIDSVLRDPQNWHSMAGCCPGMRTDVSDADIIEAVRQELDAFE